MIPTRNREIERVMLKYFGFGAATLAVLYVAGATPTSIKESVERAQWDNASMSAVSSSSDWG